MVWSSAIRNQFLVTSLVLVLNAAVFASPKDSTLPPVNDVIFTMIARDAQRQSWPAIGHNGLGDRCFRLRKGNPADPSVHYRMA